VRVNFYFERFHEYILLQNISRTCSCWMINDDSPTANTSRRCYLGRHRWKRFRLLYRCDSLGTWKLSRALVTALFYW